MNDKKLLKWYPSALSGDDGDVRAVSVKVLVSRVSHPCLANHHDGRHTIPANSKVIREMAIVDGKWYVWYTCVPCVVAWAKECGELS